MKQNTKKKLFHIFLYLVVIVMLIILFWWGAVEFLELDNYKVRLTKWFEAQFDRDVSYSEGNISLFPVPSFVFKDISVTDRNRKTMFLQIDKLTFKLSVRDLLEKKIRLINVVSQSPQITLRRNKEGSLNIDDLLKKSRDDFLDIEALHIKDGRLKFIGSSFQIGLYDLKFSMVKKTQKSYVLNFHTKIEKDGISLKGTVTTKSDLPVKEFPFELTVKASQTDIQPYTSYLQYIMPFDLKEGLINLHSSLSGTFSDLTASGEMEIINPVVAYGPLFKQDIRLNSIALGYYFRKAEGLLSIHEINCITNEQLSIQGNMLLSELFAKDPDILVTLRTSKARLKDLDRLFNKLYNNPFALFKEHVTAGSFQLIEGKLSGQFSRIKQRKALIYGKIGFEGISINPGHEWPALSDLNGLVEIDKNKVTFKDTEGAAGQSRFTVKGEIKGIRTKSEVLKFSVQTALHENDTLKILDKFVGNKLKFQGNSSLSFTVSGTTVKQDFKGTWDLTESFYSYGNNFIKGTVKKNIVEFSGAKTAEKVTFNNNISLGSIFFDVKGRYNIGENPQVVIYVQSQPFQIEEAAFHLPVLKGYLVDGKIKASAYGKGQDTSNIHWESSFQIENGSIYGLKQINRIHDIEGTVYYIDRSFQTSSLSGKIGTSKISVKGDFKRPSLRIKVTAPKLNLSDFGLVQKKGLYLKPENFKASFSVHGRHVNILSLEATVNNSVINLNGTVENGLFTRVQLYVSAKQLSLSDVLLITGIRPKGKSKNTFKIYSIKATIHSEAGYLNVVPYKQLYTVVTYKDNMVKLEPIRFNAFDGRVEADTTIDLFISNFPGYKLDFNIYRVDAMKFLNFVGVKRQFLEGDLDLKGNISSMGTNKAEFIQNLSGNTHLITTNGFLKNLPVHAKVFYALNVSQLLQFRLPNLDREKMLYSKISGSLSFDYGIMSTQDLQTYTDNVNMTVVGTMNLNNKQIDLTIGIQPFKTVERIVDILPGSGWLLSGNGKKFLTVYFSAKGHWENPNVETLPVKYIPKHIFNIFRMTFGLP